jgi:hypothetical protein
MLATHDKQAGREKMATRTAPTVSATTATSQIVGISMIDASEDVFSDSLKMEAGALGVIDLAEIEAWVADYQPATQASIFEVRHTSVWRGSANPTNADVAFRASIADGINVNYLDTDVFNSGIGHRVPAPVAAWLQGNSDVVIVPAVGVAAALLAQTITMLNSLGSGYSLETMQFTTRRERKNNPKRRA